MPLWPKDYFRLPIIQKPQIQKKLLKASKSYPCVRDIYIYKRILTYKSVLLPSHLEVMLDEISRSLETLIVRKVLDLKERQCQRMFKLLYDCAHFTCKQDSAHSPSNQISTICELRTSKCTDWIQKRQRKQISSCQHPLNRRKNKQIPKSICFIDYSGDFDYVDHYVGKFIKRCEYQTT